MLKITLKPRRLFNEKTQEFINIDKPIELRLEHSLISISKWEAKYHRSFMDDPQDKTPEEIIDYIRCMTLTQNVPYEAYYLLNDDNINEIMDYIGDPHTATTFSDYDEKTGKKEIITSELIYYWMIAGNVPVEFEKWHLNRLLVLIRIIGIKNEPDKKLSKQETMARQKSINARRREELKKKKGLL